MCECVEYTIETKRSNNENNNESKIFATFTSSASQIGDSTVVEIAF